MTTPMTYARKRHLLVLRFYQEGSPEERDISIQGLNFRISTHFVGLSDQLAALLIARYDGVADGIVVSSRDRLNFEGEELLLPKIRALLPMAQKTPVYQESELEKLFSSWVINRMAKLEPELFRGKKWLFHCAGYTSLSAAVLKEGAKVAGLDPLVLLGKPIKLEGAAKLKGFYRALRSFHGLRQLSGRNVNKNMSALVLGLVTQWIKKSDVFVSTASLMAGWPQLDMLRDKILLIDYLSDSLSLELTRVGVKRVIQWYPQLVPSQVLRPSFSLLRAVIDQFRIIESPDQDFESFALDFINQNPLFPENLSGPKKTLRRCAFVIHPLSRDQIFNAPGLKWLKSGPEVLKKTLEKFAAYGPAMKVGEIVGIKSLHDGQELQCDLYALFATPREMLAMKEEKVYERLLKAADLAHQAGARIIGLGAYTKVVGDAGVTVARRASLPVTTGNSYTVAATLWAAHEMVSKLGFLRREPGMKKFNGRAVVIGATGSIGRVCSLLLARAFQELYLVAPAALKLLELRDEVLAYAPGTQVKVATQPKMAIQGADLIITSTSAQGERILSMADVKPGAVICDCSRPLDISKADAEGRPDVLVIESGEIDLPGKVSMNLDIGLPGQSVYACLAETVLLALEGRYENYSLSRQLSFEKVREIYRMGLKHGAKLSAIHGPLGMVTDEMIREVRKRALEKRPPDSPQNLILGVSEGAKAQAEPQRPSKTTHRSKGGGKDFLL